MKLIKPYMKVAFLIIIALLVTVFGSSFRTKTIEDTSVCMSGMEQQLVNHINAYRKQQGLPAIVVSHSLTKVARLHARDLAINQPVTDRCNMHSWSNKGSWKGCCYDKNYKCMWEKPSEISNGTYTATGFEVAYWYSADITDAMAPLNSWKGSKGHNDVLINQGIWKGYPWKAIGVGIYKGYAVAWVAQEADSKSAGACN